MPVSRRLASLREAGEYAACSYKTIRRMVSRGELTGYRVGKRLLRVDLEELDGLLLRIPTAGDVA